MSDELYVVKNARGRVLMEFHQEADARKYVEENFPRPHVEAGIDTPDVVLITPGGDRDAYVNGAWVEGVDWETVEGRFSPRTPVAPAKKTSTPK